MIEVLNPLIDLLKSFVQTYGGIGLFLSMIIQAVIVIIPSEGVLLVAGMLMNKWEVTFWAGLGSIAGASISFLIAKKGGRPIIKKLLGEDSLAFMDHWAEKWGDKGILIGRLIPFIPYDPISYLSGITKIKFKNFTIYNILGTIPRVIMYASLGEFVKKYEVFGAVIVAVLVSCLFVASVIIKRKYKSERIN